MFCLVVWGEPELITGSCCLNVCTQMASSSGASLTLENNVVEGRMWEALNRPGTLSQTGNKIVVPAGEYVREGQAEDSDC